RFAKQVQFLGVVEAMITLLKRFFVENWARKLLSLILAIVVWVVVKRSLIATKTISDVPVRVINLNPGKTIEGMQANGILSEKVSLSLVGNRFMLDEMGSRDLEIVLDAKDKPNEWIAVIGKKNLVSLNPDINLEKGLSRVASIERIIRQSKHVKEKIPIIVTEPIGEAPKGYQYLDVFPYQLNLNVEGPEETIKQLKNGGGLTLTFNLSDISVAELDILQKTEKRHSDEISFFVPNSWKKVMVPGLSETEMEIDDPQAKGLRIDFARQDLLPINAPIPVSLFFPAEGCSGINPETCALVANDFVVKKNGVKMITQPLFAQGVSRKFLDLVKDRIQIAITSSLKGSPERLLWNVQLMCPQELEDRFVAKSMAELSAELRDVQPSLREDYLRNRFHSYMNSFRLYTPGHKKLKLAIRVDGNAVLVTPENYP
ncbi:MAG: hypothetical protein HY324_00535, partial [Chlamydiia bacterium]|nr:hypothetical protein [Chlamydiia bacterium]